MHGHATDFLLKKSIIFVGGSNLNGVRGKIVKMATRFRCVRKDNIGSISIGNLSGFPILFKRISITR